MIHFHLGVSVKKGMRNFFYAPLHNTKHKSKIRSNKLNLPISINDRMKHLLLSSDTD